MMEPRKDHLFPRDGLEIGVIAGNHISMNLNRHGAILVIS